VTYRAPTRLGIAPAVAAAAISALPALREWVSGHSTTYRQVEAAIPELGRRALAGDLAAMAVLLAWDGNQQYCRMAIDDFHDYMIGTNVGDPGPCGVAPGLKSLVHETWVRVATQNNAVYAETMAMASVYGGLNPGGEAKGDWWAAREAVTPSPGIETYTDYSGVETQGPLFAPPGGPALASIFGNIPPLVLIGGAGLLVLGLLTSRKG